MALITTGQGSSGGAFPPSEWTVGADGNLEIAPTDNTDDYLVSVKAPAGFFLNSPLGTILRLTDESGNAIHEFLVEGNYNMTAQAGFSQSIIRLRSVDYPGNRLTIQSGIADGSVNFIEARHETAGDVFVVTGGGTFRVTPAVDDFGLSIEAVDNATSPSFYVNAAPGQTGSLFEVGTLPDGLSSFTLKPDGSVLAPMLPTADPLVAGQLWNSSGVVHVSAG